MRLGELGEGGLIKRVRNRFLNSGVTLGIGDDAAILEFPPGHSIVYCSDLVAEGTHFIRSLHPPDSVGYKAVAVNVSDVGAMGGVPMHFVISMAAPADLDVEWIDGFYTGVERACRDFEVSLVGGDTSSADQIFVDVAMIGRVKTGNAVRRSGARTGDGIFVTGSLGASMMGFELLRSGTGTGAAASHHLYPHPRHKVGAAVAERAHAMIDVSDGLSTDLTHILEESNVSARIYRDRLPAAEGATDSHVLHGGEEYELILVGPEIPATVEGVPVTRIGEIIAITKSPQILLVQNSSQSVLKPQGWQHYKSN